jgi:hypothetical protein
MFDQNGLDLLQGLCANRSAFVAEEKPIVYTGTSLHPYVDECDVLTLRVSNNLNPSAVTVIDVYVALGA